MRYLCFDIECCDGEHICEFGYVITDSHFNILNKEVILINPEKKFNLTGRTGQKDLKLFFSEEEYNNSETFPYYFKQIKDLIYHEDQIIIGHAINNDAKFLNIACKRYKLGPLDFEFFDSQKAFQEYKSFEDISLAEAGEKLGIKKPKYLHKSDEDAMLTIEVVKSMCINMQMSLIDFMKLCPEACGYNTRYFPVYKGNGLIDRLNKLFINENFVSNNKKQKTIDELSKKICPKCSIIESILNNKKICFSADYEKGHFKETLILIQCLSNYGCVYNRVVSENDFYVATNEELTSTEKNVHSRYYAATEITEDGRNVKVISFDTLYKLLNISEEQIVNMSFPKPSYFKLKRKNKTQKQSNVTHLQTCIGDLISWNKMKK